VSWSCALTPLNPVKIFSLLHQRFSLLHSPSLICVVSSTDSLSSIWFSISSTPIPQPQPQPNSTNHQPHITQPLKHPKLKPPFQHHIKTPSNPHTKPRQTPFKSSHKINTNPIKSSHKTNKETKGTNPIWVWRGERRDT
jgi:hypothetical protein